MNLFLDEVTGYLWDGTKGTLIALFISAVAAMAIPFTIANFQQSELKKLSWKKTGLILLGLSFLSCVPGLIVTNSVLPNDAALPVLASNTETPIAVEDASFITMAQPPSATKTPPPPTFTLTPTATSTPEATSTETPTSTPSPTFTAAPVVTIVTVTNTPMSVLTPTPTPPCYKGRFWFEKPRFGETFSEDSTIKVEIVSRNVCSQYGEYELKVYPGPTPFSNWNDWETVVNRAELTCSRIETEFTPPTSTNSSYWLLPKLIEADDRTNYLEPISIQTCAIRINIQR